jgi:homoserine kinase
MIKVRVPATTANMGPGFDSFGMALNLYNEITVEKIDAGIEFLENGQPSDIPLKENLIYKCFSDTMESNGFPCDGFRINMTKCDVPMSRGLGSSATCILAGIAAANEVMGGILTVDDIINEATRIEGHPDNIVPAAVGGMVVSLVYNEKVEYSRVNIPENISMFVMVPNFKLSTEDARGVLPKTYTRGDCVFNLSRAAMFVNAMNNKELDKLRVSTQDKIHQDYRKSLIRNTDDIFKAAEQYGALAEFISGSGSTLIALIEDDNKEFYTNMKEFLESLEDTWQVYILKPDFEGVRVYR